MGWGGAPLTKHDAKSHTKPSRERYCNHELYVHAVIATNGIPQRAVRKRKTCEKDFMNFAAGWKKNKKDGSLNFIAWIWSDFSFSKAGMIYDCVHISWWGCGRLSPPFFRIANTRKKYRPPKIHPAPPFVIKTLSYFCLHYHEVMKSPTLCFVSTWAHEFHQFDQFPLFFPLINKHLALSPSNRTLQATPSPHQ